MTLTTADIPARHLDELAERLGEVGEIPDVARTEPAGFQVGDTTQFWFKNRNTGQNEQVTAFLAYQSDLIALWFQEGERVRDNDLNDIVTTLEEQIIPTNRRYFGTEWQPGVDGDARFHILHLSDIGPNVGGYFSAADEYVQAVNPFSNEREMIYIDIDGKPLDLGGETYLGVLAHEYQHMIHWHADANESAWLNEGMAELAAWLNGFPSTDSTETFAENPDVQLNVFSYQPDVSGQHYGASFFFAAYYLDRFGDTALTQLVQNPLNSTASFADPDFNVLFADWVVANYLDGHGLGDGVHQYSNLDVPEIDPTTTIRRFPNQAEAGVHQYGADYLRVLSDEPVTLTFTGTTQVNLLPTQPAGSDYFWSTLPADGSDMTLTGRFDLTSLDTASLTYQTWYAIEADWDYAYVTISSDDGATWQLLTTPAMTDSNPQGNSYGTAYTGYSGGGDEPVWIDEQIDLTPWAGQEIWLRFEYVTDDAFHEAGWALDNIAIPELDFNDDAETDAGVWQPAGFARHTNLLPQQWLLQLLLLSDDDYQLQQLELGELQQGVWTLPLDSTYDEAIIIISGITPVTTEPAGYAYQLNN